MSNYDTTGSCLDCRNYPEECNGKDGCKPVEKTCGNCVEFDPDNQVCTMTDEDGNTEAHKPTDPACVDWHLYVPTIEERYEQLEQVVKDMLELLDSAICTVRLAEAPLTADCLRGHTNDLRSRLEAIGVDV